MDSLDRKLALKSLFECQGYKMFKEELDALLEADKIKQDNLSKSPVADYILNFNNGHKQGLVDVNYILDGFREELTEIAGER